MVSKYMKLADGGSIPTLGLGVYKTPKGVAEDIVFEALKIGYRHIDCAEVYANEKESGAGILRWLKETPGAKREDVFYTTKVYDYNQGYEKATEAIKLSLQMVEGLEYIDLMLIHSPQSNRAKRLGTWKALEDFHLAGKIKHIGVSNYGINHIQELLDWEELRVKPVVNQIELSPWLMRTDLIDYMKSKDIVAEAYCPLTRGKRLTDPIVVELAEKYKKSPAQILIRWSLQAGFIPLPKTADKGRAKANFDIWDFNIEQDDVDRLQDPTAYDPVAWDPIKYEDKD